MRKEWKWLVLVMVAAGLLTAGVLVFSVPRLGWVGLDEYRQGYCPCCGGTGVFNPWGVLATLAIGLLMLSIPLGHIGILILAVTWIARSDRSPGRVGYGHSVEDASQTGGGAVN
jgi:hypothetical protein